MKDISYKFPKSGRVKINGAFGSDDGMVGGFGKDGKKFVENYEKITFEDAKKRAEWVTKLRALGVKGAHADDGWHNREGNSFNLCYPHFNDGLEIGDMFALGDYQKFSVVIVKKITGFFTKTYHYK